VRWVSRYDLADHKPVEEHPHRSELLLDARLRMGLAALLDVGGDDRRVDVVDVVNFLS
jgi:hypothetical protein